MDAPMTYFGGKTYLAPTIASLIPPRVFSLYAEPFCGSAAIFFSAPGRWAKTEILNDVNHDLIRFYQVMQDDAKRDKLLGLLDVTPHSRFMWQQARCEMDKNHDDVTLAWYWFIMHQQSFSATRDSWKIVTKKRNVAGQWRDRVEYLGVAKLIERLKDATLENISFERMWKLYDSPDALFYVDPPYIGAKDQRGLQRAYSGHVLTPEQDALLVKLCIESKAGIILSGYPRDDLPRNWQRIEIKKEVLAQRMPKDSDTPRRIATEVIWVSPNAQIGRLF